MERPAPKIGGSCRLLHGQNDIIAVFVSVDEVGRTAVVSYSKSGERYTQIVSQVTNNLIIAQA
jgi:hypothetical protein